MLPEQSLNGLAFWESFCGKAWKSLCEVAPSFSTVEVHKFAYEMRAYRLEMIGLAWTLRTKERFALAQGEFTQRYLTGRGCVEALEGVRITD